jgi:hypothetical protein
MDDVMQCLSLDLINQQKIYTLSLALIALAVRFREKEWMGSAEAPKIASDEMRVAQRIKLL